MNNFDDQAPLSKIGIAAMFGILLGMCFLIYGFVESFLCDFYSIWFPVNILLLVLGGGFVVIGVRVACSKVAYKNRE